MDFLVLCPPLLVIKLKKLYNIILKNELVSNIIYVGNKFILGGNYV